MDGPGVTRSNQGSTAALTTDGLVQNAVTSLSFSTGAIVLPVPTVGETTRSNGSAEFSLELPLLISFSLVTNLTRGEASFSSSHGAAAGTFSSPSALGWAPTTPLAYNTTCPVAIATLARRPLGVALPFTFAFELRAPASTGTFVPPSPTTVPSAAPGAPYTGVGIVLRVVVAGPGAFAGPWHRPPPAPGVGTADPVPVAPPGPWDRNVASPSGQEPK